MMTGGQKPKFKWRHFWPSPVKDHLVRLYHEWKVKQKIPYPEISPALCMGQWNGCWRNNTIIIVFNSFVSFNVNWFVTCRLKWLLYL
jgi:hypothetical protein